MTLHIRAHFDGRFLVPDHPVDLPLHQPLNVDVTPCDSTQSQSNGHTPVDGALIDERRRRLHASAGTFSGSVLSDEALRRENMYDDQP